jgi:hypothetical protein
MAHNFWAWPGCPWPCISGGDGSCVGCYLVPINRVQRDQTFKTENECDRKNTCIHTYTIFTCVRGCEEAMEQGKRIMIIKNWKISRMGVAERTLITIGWYDDSASSLPCCWVASSILQSLERWSPYGAQPAAMVADLYGIRTYGGCEPHIAMMISSWRQQARSVFGDDNGQAGKLTWADSRLISIWVKMKNTTWFVGPVWGGGRIWHSLFSLWEIMESEYTGWATFVERMKTKLG